MNELKSTIPAGFVSHPLFAIKEIGALFSMDIPAVITATGTRQVFVKKLNASFAKSGCSMWQNFGIGSCSEIYLSKHEFQIVSQTKKITTGSLINPITSPEHTIIKERITVEYSTI